MKSVYIVRHGETDLNYKNNNQLIDQPKDIELNENGKEQSIKTGKYLNNRKNKIDLIICSDTLRAKQTAELIAKEIDYKNEIIFEKKLAETLINEKYKDLKSEEFKNLKNSDENVKKFFEYHEQKSKIKNPIELNEYIIKYEAEPTNDVYEKPENISNRVNDVIETIKLLSNQNILIVSHGATIRWINKILTNNIGSDEFQGELINGKSNCAITYYIYQNDTFFLVSANSNKHLKYL